MTPDDPRHGTQAGQNAHSRAGEPGCDACNEAHRKAQIIRKLYPPKTRALGSRRRIQALQAIGHSRQAVAERLGYVNSGALGYIMKPSTMTLRKTTAARIAAVYDELCMTVPVGPGAERARIWARKHGYPPPLAWDDIDNDPAPSGGFTGTLAQRQGPSRASVDHARVERIVAQRDFTLAGEATQGERAAVLARWPGTLNELERLTGWRVDRYHLPNGAA